MRGSPAKQGRLPRDPPPPLTASPHLTALPRAPPGHLGRDWVFLALRVGPPCPRPSGSSRRGKLWLREATRCLPAARCQRVVPWSPWPCRAPLVHNRGAGARSRAGTHWHRCTVARWVHRGSAGPLPASIPCGWVCGHPQAHKDTGTGCPALGRAGEASKPSAQGGTANSSMPETRPQKLASPCGQGGLAAAVPSWGAPSHPGGAACAGRGDGEGTPGVPR